MRRYTILAGLVALCQCACVPDLQVENLQIITEKTDLTVRQFEPTKVASAVFLVDFHAAFHRVLRENEKAVAILGLPLLPITITQSIRQFMLTQEMLFKPLETCSNFTRRAPIPAEIYEGRECRVDLSKIASMVPKIANGSIKLFDTKKRQYALLSLTLVKGEKCS